MSCLLDSLIEFVTLVVPGPEVFDHGPIGLHYRYLLLGPRRRVLPQGTAGRQPRVDHVVAATDRRALGNAIAKKNQAKQI